MAATLMMMLLLRARTRLKSSRGRRRLAGQSLVVALALAMLVIPATCAEAAGPHSMFIDPASGYVHHHPDNRDQSESPPTQAALERHVVLGDGAPGRPPISAGSTPVPTHDCPGDVRFTDLPSTLAISAVSSPATLGDALRLEFPACDEPPAIEPPALHATLTAPEAPPPRNI